MNTKTVVMIFAAIAALLAGGFLILQKKQGVAAKFSQASLPEPLAKKASSFSQDAARSAMQQEMDPAKTLTKSTEPKTQSPKLLAQLASENALLRNGMVDLARMDSALKRENFGKTVSAFEVDARSDTLATQMTNAYRATLEATLAGVEGGKVLERFSCGLSLCVGSIRSMNGAKLPENWWEQVNVGEKLSIYAMSQASTELGRGHRETRFLFSTSQTNNGFYSRAPTP